ncbi:hypothetical protein COY95_01380 [Candidatus Woesearchaeota archaeon CG_4_10_14_0_8_um_filter_47_5]|nr:MAG: hypothetical protein COY95_01380 [Candidatus Woesearchaeota archaeon CG_4_10_14_0_8_um_filter_47_5]
MPSRYSPFPSPQELFQGPFLPSSPLHSLHTLIDYLSEHIVDHLTDPITGAYETLSDRISATLSAGGGFMGRSLKKGALTVALFAVLGASACACPTGQLQLSYDFTGDGQPDTVLAELLTYPTVYPTVKVALSEGSVMILPCLPLGKLGEHRQQVQSLLYNYNIPLYPSCAVSCVAGPFPLGDEWSLYAAVVEGKAGINSLEPAYERHEPPPGAQLA